MTNASFPPSGDRLPGFALQASPERWFVEEDFSLAIGYRPGEDLASPP